MKNGIYILTKINKLYYSFPCDFNKLIIKLKIFHQTSKFFQLQPYIYKKKRKKLMTYPKLAKQCSGLARASTPDKVLCFHSLGFKDSSYDHTLYDMQFFT